MIVFRFAAGVLLLIGAVYAVSSGLFGPIVALPFAVASGVCLYPFLAAPLVNALTALFYPRGGAELPEQFSMVRALMAQQQFEEAAEQLRAMLAERPTLVEGRALLVSVLYENLHQPGDALQLALTELGERTWHTEHERLTMLAVDILLDAGRQSDASELLRRMAAKARDTSAAARLDERLSHLSI